MATTTKLEESLTKLEQEIQNLLESGDWKKYLKTQSKFHNYSFRNILPTFRTLMISTNLN